MNPLDKRCLTPERPSILQECREPSTMPMSVLTPKPADTNSPSNLASPFSISQGLALFQFPSILIALFVKAR